MKILERVSKLHLLLYLITFIEVYSQSNFIDENDIINFASPAIKIYTNKDGLPQSSIMSIAVDKTGYLWIGTQDGAAYYDGHKWVTVNLPDRTVSNYVRTI
ncbi:MAG: two-component regulator propeller domain-containing protein [Ignavibacteria bacterium]|nr:two-component regulator propeller domain-containing protein [Ignavibacteria bacterium]